MENLGILRSAIMAFTALSLLLPGPSTAYFDAGKAHAAINDVAFERFVTGWMPKDPSLTDCSLDRNKVLAGPAWDLDMGLGYLGQEPNQIRSKTVKNWLKSGGFSADEPEIPRAIRHFYIPHGQVPYLSDLKAEFDALTEAKAYCLGATIPVTAICGVTYVGIKMWVNWAGVSEDFNEVLKNGVLGINAVDWAFDRPDNPYTFSKAKEYYKAALASTDSAESENSYSKAWRAVGETMHMISDMTVPSHVRNDGHGIQAEPFELFATEPRIMKNNDPVLFTPCSTLDYGRKTPDKNLKTFMKDVATWTSENFFSQDTITIEGQDTTNNGQPAFSSPKLDEFHTLTEDGNTYYYNYISTTNGLGLSQPLKIKQVHKPWTFMLFPSAELELDRAVLIDQASILIPTAIEASSAVMDAFLPRFEVVVDNVADNPSSGEGMEKIEGHIKHLPTIEWPASSNLVIRNGAYIRVIDSTGKETLHKIPCPESGDLNNIEWNGKLESSDKITLEYNLGGYVIKSKPYEPQDCGSVDYSKLTKIDEKIDERLIVLYLDSNGLRQGAFEAYFDEDKKELAEKGCFLNDKENGYWMGWNLVGEKYYKLGEGNFKDGKKEGHWIWYDEYTGEKSIEGNFKDDKREGHWIWYGPAGCITSEGDYKDDMEEGHWIEYWCSTRNKHVESDYKNGNLIGDRVYYNEDGSVAHKGLVKCTLCY